MNSKAILAIAALAAVASTGVRADEADASQFAVKFEGTRTRAEVQGRSSHGFLHPQHRAGRFARCCPDRQSSLDPKWCAQKPPKRFAWAKPPTVKSATCKPCAPKQTTPLPRGVFFGLRIADRTDRDGPLRQRANSQLSKP